MSLQFREVPIQNIVVNPSQPRRDFRAEELEELASSLRSIGMIHPPTVRTLTDSHKFELIAGERRWRAAQLAGFTSIGVFILSSSDYQSAEMALAENIQRSDLNPLEIAFALKALAEEHGLSQQQLANKMGKNRSTIANYLRLLGLPLKVQQSLQSNEITMGHAKAILALSDVEQQQNLLEKIIKEQLSVRQAEKTAAKLHAQNKEQTQPLLPFPQKDVHLERCCQELQYALGTKTAIHPRNGNKGMICIEYYNLEDLERLLKLMGVEHDS